MAVFVDVDGTLTNDRGLVPDSARQAVQAARLNGHLVFLCTGRSPIDVWPPIMEIGFDGLVAGAGAYVEVGGQVLAHSVFTAEQVESVRSALTQMRCEYLFESVDGHVASGGALALIQRTIDLAGDDADLRADLERGLGGFREGLRPGTDPRDALVHKVSFHSAVVSVDQVASRLGPQFSVVSSVAHVFGPGSGEIALATVHKGAGVRMVVEHLGLPIEATAALGDGYNDIDMLRAVGVGIAMAGAPDDLTAVASAVTDSPDGHGLRNAFERLGLIAGRVH